MELKLVDSKPVSNEIIDSFYQRLEQQQLDAERQEELEYNESGIITRRKFLQYSALGAVGLGLGLSTEEAEANYLYLLLPVLWLAREVYRSYHPLSGEITVINKTDKNISNQMILTVKKTRDIREVTAAKAKYYAPAFQEVTYHFENGPYAVARKNTKAYACASNNKGNSSNKGFYLNA